MTKTSQIRPEDVVAQAQRLRELRATTGLSQEKFAESVGLGYGQWSNFESARQRIGIDAALTLTRKMFVSLDWIYTGNGMQYLPPDLREALRRVQETEATAAQKPLKR